jgi:hypothetical protein
MVDVEGAEEVSGGGCVWERGVGGGEGGGGG